MESTEIINLEAVNTVDFYTNLYRSYAKRSEAYFRRMKRNWDLYSGVDFKQWDQDQVRQLIEEGRAPHQVNFIQNYVTALLGNSINEELETEFLPEYKEQSDSTLALNQAYLADKDRTKWNKEVRKFIRAGIIMRGVGEIYMDYSTDPLGAIAFRNRNARRVIFDPQWDTEDVNDNEAIIEFSWMTPVEIKNVYNKKSHEIESAIRDYNLSKTSVGTDELTNEQREALLYSDSIDFVDLMSNRFLVVQITEIKQVFKDRLYDLEKLDFMPDISSGNQEIMLAMRGDKLKVVRDKVAVVKVTTIAPGLSRKLVLEQGNHPIQIGRYPYFVFSYMTANGVPHGAVDVLADIQQMYNKRESMFTHWQTTAANGAEFIEESFFANDSEKNKYINNKNVPGKTYIVRDGSVSNGRAGIGTRPRDNIPNDLHTSADRAFNMIYHIAPNIQALAGGEGKSGESGKLFKEKRAQALVALAPLDKAREDFHDEFGEAYFYLAKQKYSGAPRRIVNPNDGTEILINIPTQSGVVENDFSKLSRHKVRVSKSKRGISVREELLNRYVELLPYFQNPILKSQLEKAAMSVMPNIPESELKVALQSADKFVQLQNSRVDVESLQNTFGALQIFMQMQQLQNQQAKPSAQTGAPQLPGAAAMISGTSPVGEGGGMSVEGKAMKPGQSVPVDVKSVNQMNN